MPRVVEEPAVSSPPQFLRTCAGSMLRCARRRRSCHGGPGFRHQPHGGLRSLAGRRSHGDRRRARRLPLRQPDRLRRLQRDRADRGVLRAAARRTGSRGAATGGSTTPSTWPRSPRSATATATAAPTTSGSWPGKDTQRSAAFPETAPQRRRLRPTPSRRPLLRRLTLRSPEGSRGTTPSPARPAHTPSTDSSVATPGPATHPMTPAHKQGRTHRETPPNPLTQRGFDMRGCWLEADHGGRPSRFGHSVRSRAGRTGIAGYILGLDGRCSGQSR